MNRDDFWAQAFMASRSEHFNMQCAASWADNALAEFDKRFPSEASVAAARVAKAKYETTIRKRIVCGSCGYLALVPVETDPQAWTCPQCGKQYGQEKKI